MKRVEPGAGVEGTSADVWGLRSLKAKIGNHLIVGGNRLLADNMAAEVL